MTEVSSFSGWAKSLEEESWPEWKDYQLVVLFALIIPGVRFILDRFVFEPIGRWQLYPKHVAKLSKDELEARAKSLAKFKESAWKLTYFLTAEAFSLAVTYDEPWFTDTKYFWMGTDSQKWPNIKAKLKLKLLYAFAGGFYTYSILALIFWETRRKDFGVSMSHHVATVILIIFSYIVKFYRIGSIVLALHDANDVFLEVAKMSKYTGLDRMAEIAFGLFAVSWLLLRLVYFPFWIIWSSSIGILRVLDKHDHPVEGPWLYYIFNTLLIMLLVLHIYWWLLIWRMIVNQLFKSGLSKDVRSDSDNEHED